MCIDAIGLEQIYYGFDSFDSVTFTSCGKFVIIKPVAAMYPITKEIPHKLQKLFDTSIETGDPKGDEKELINSENKSPFPKTSGFQLAPSKVVDGSQVVVRAQGRSSGISTSHGANNVHIHLWNDDGEGRAETNFEFSKLPNWIGADNVSASLLPQLREERIRIVLEASRRPWSDLSKKGKNGPVLVERNRRAINYSYRQDPYSQARKARARSLRDARALRQHAEEVEDDWASFMLEN